MDKIFLEEKHIFEYIKDIISSAKLKSVTVSNAKYHHNRNYNSVPFILKHGILSAVTLNELVIKKYPEELLCLMDDLESHINGKNGVSLAVMGLTDLYTYEEEYNPFNQEQVDFLITSDLKTIRSSHHYGNEFIFEGDITPNRLRSLDIRLLQLVETIENRFHKEPDINKIIVKFNYVRNIALSLKQCNLDIPFREMSFDQNNSLDIDKILKSQILVLKKDIA